MATKKKQRPADPDGMNEQRALSASLAIAEFQNDTRTDDEDALSDLLCNLRHYADLHDLDWDLEMSRAMMHYEAETTSY
jgi:hypothetical protein